MFVDQWKNVKLFQHFFSPDFPFWCALNSTGKLYHLQCVTAKQD